MKTVSRQGILEFLNQLGSRYPRQATLHLLGGGAMILLGRSRDTLDIDYVGDDIQKNEFQIAIEKTADELELETEAVPLEHFIPLPEGNEQRRIRIGQFGNVDVYVIDPYSIALSKLDRGHVNDMEDLVFLIQQNHITLDELERITKRGLARAGKFDFHPEILSHLQDLKNLLK